ncbi:hypothetical protein A7U60_g8462 [Sanghuangporus baumii]|uniref:Uncharacterized protein n=1 Tax=Sanghuangporus baumii TaxID=108892 RepID=A0A9Q5HR56_SANBA|nr:hypothetical protein A7U60_g8462 [Sanghuangporus baumii]
MSSAAQRAKRREEIDHAYGEVARAATWGAVKYGLFGASLATLAHFTWPTFRVTKAHVPAPAVVCTGLVFYAEDKLQTHEAATRIKEGRLRREARIDLARRGLVGTETEIAKWKEEREARLREEQAQAQAQNAAGPNTAGLVFYAEDKLQTHEAATRIKEGRLRREARIDLARRGLVGTETEIAKWKEEREARLREEQAQAQAQNAAGPNTAGSS